MGFLYLNLKVRFDLNILSNVEYIVINILVPNHLMSVQFSKSMTGSSKDSGTTEYCRKKDVNKMLSLTSRNSGLMGRTDPRNPWQEGTHGELTAVIELLAVKVANGCSFSLISFLPERCPWLPFNFAI